MYKRLKIIIQNNNNKVITQSIPSQPKKMKTAKQNRNQQLFKIFLAGLERIELPPSVSKTEMISISPKPA